MVRKPIREVNVATQVKKTGTGAINIDGCRVEGLAEKPGGKIRSYRRTEATTSVGLQENELKAEMVDAPDPHPGGRWPAHLVLSHAPGCQKVGIRKVKGSGTSKTFHESYEGESSTKFLRGWSHPGNQHADEDGTETVEDWSCASECPVRMLDEQSGELKTNGGTITPEMQGMGYHGAKGRTTEIIPDAGGASRFFKTFESEGWECVPECPVRQLDEQSIEGGIHSAGAARLKVVQTNYDATSYDMSGSIMMHRFGDSGGASRFFTTFEPEAPAPFFYTAKASRSEMDAGIETDPKLRRAVVYGAKKQRECNVCGSRTCVPGPTDDRSWPSCGHGDWRWVEQLEEGHKGGNAKNTHPTVKPIKLMSYLVRLVTPKGGVVLDPFAGSGSTLIAALREGARFIGIEREEEYSLIAESRVRHVAEEELERQEEAAVFNLLAELEQENF